MKQEEYQPLSLNHKGCMYMPSEEVRSAVMGLLEYFCSYYQGTVEGSCFHQGHHLCESCNEFYKWFPIFLKT